MLACSAFITALKYIILNTFIWRSLMEVNCQFYVKENCLSEYCPLPAIWFIKYFEAGDANEQMMVRFNQLRGNSQGKCIRCTNSYCNHYKKYDLVSFFFVF